MQNIVLSSVCPFDSENTGLVDCATYVELSQLVVTERDSETTLKRTTTFRAASMVYSEIVES